MHFSPPKGDRARARRRPRQTPPGGAGTIWFDWPAHWMATGMSIGSPVPPLVVLTTATRPCRCPRGVLSRPPSPDLPPTGAPTPKPVLSGTAAAKGQPFPRPPTPRASTVRPRDSPLSIGATARRHHIASAPSIARGPRRRARCGQPTPPAPLEAHQRGNQDVLRDGDGSRRWVRSTPRFRPRSTPLSTCEIDREMRKRQSKGH